MGVSHPGVEEALHGFLMEGRSFQEYIPGAGNVPPFPALVTNVKTGTMCC